MKCINFYRFTELVEENMDRTDGLIDFWVEQNTLNALAEEAESFYFEGESIVLVFENGERISLIRNGQVGNAYWTVSECGSYLYNRFESVKNKECKIL